MTLDARAWVAAREPAPPPALAARLSVALGTPSAAPNDEPHDDADSPNDPMAIARACARAAERGLAEVLTRDAASRETALALLTADSLATFAFEAASAAPEALPAMARDTLRRLAVLGRAP